MSLGTPEILIIIVLVLVLFGPDKLPDLARSLGRGIRQFRNITSEFSNHFDLSGDDDEKPRRAASTTRPAAHEKDDFQPSQYDTMHLPNVHAPDNYQDDYTPRDNTSRDYTSRDETDHARAANAQSSGGESIGPEPARAQHELNLAALLPTPRTRAPQPIDESAPKTEDRAPDSLH